MAHASLKEQFLNYVRAGAHRVRAGFFQSIQITIASMGAYLFAERVLGHEEPIFAAVAALVSLGYVSGSTHSRRILEVSFGVSLGILIGDLFLQMLGRGIWQATLALFISVLLARFLDNGIIFTIQLSFQACLVILLPPTSDLPFTRSLDGVIGGVAAFLMMFLMPKDPRNGSRQRAEALMSAFSDVFFLAAKAIRRYNYDQAYQSLQDSRKLQPLYEASKNDLVTARGMAQLSWAGKKTRIELDRLAQTLGAIDLAIRNTRVFNRRMASTIAHVQLRPKALETLSAALEELALAAQSTGLGMYSSTEHEREHYMEVARERLISLAETLEPKHLGVETFEGESLVLMLRLITVDMLEATGMDHEDAVATLVPLGEAVTEHAPRTSEIPIVQADVAGAQEEDLRTRTVNIMLRDEDLEEGLG